MCGLTPLVKNVRRYFKNLHTQNYFFIFAVATLIITIMVTIANAIYDSVFKYLMQDNKAAKVLLGALIGAKIDSLEMKNNEYAYRVRNGLDVLRIDFSASITDYNGNKQVVTIELQNASLRSEVMRFRKYLSEHYADKNNFVEKDGKKSPIPIISIYILGHPCCDKKEPVIYGNPVFYDAEYNELKGVYDKSDFIKGLIHKLIIVQVPYLKINAKTKVEKYLDFLNQVHKIDKTRKNAHLLRVSEETDDDDYNLIVRRLQNACADDYIRRAMDVEDELNEDFEYRDRMEAKLKEELQAKDSELQAKDSQLQEKDSQLQEKDSQLQAKDSELQAMLAASAKALASKGMSPDEIAKFLNVPVNKILEVTQ